AGSRRAAQESPGCLIFAGSLARFALPMAQQPQGWGSLLASRIWLRRRGCRLSSAEAAPCALSPLLATVVLLVVLVLQQALVGCLPAVQRLWHEWQHPLYELPFAHGLIHAANFPLLAFAGFRLARVAYVLARLRTFANRPRAAASAGSSSV